MHRVRRMTANLRNLLLTSLVLCKGLQCGQSDGAEMKSGNKDKGCATHAIIVIFKCAQLHGGTLRE